MAQAIMKEDDSQAVIITDTDRHILAISGKPDVLTADHQRAAMEGRISKGKGSLIFGAPIYQGNTEGDAFDLFDSTTKERAEKAKLLGYVYLELSTASSQRSKNLFAIVSLLIGVIGTAFASVLALRMSNDLTRPLSRLIDGVHRMAQGEFSTRILANSGGEIQELEDGFNKMASEIQRSHDEMLEVNTNLEKLVGERTRQLELKNQDLEYLSNTDRLTGLYNRFKLETILDEEHLRSQRYGSDFALTIIDVDKFKSVNDTYGHQVGDQVLISIGKILQKTCAAVMLLGAGAAKNSSSSSAKLPQKTRLLLRKNCVLRSKPTNSTP
jgi:nitrate/nitrite-specific signal transduction histidine kinase